jgi:hypothetical protein
MREIALEPVRRFDEPPRPSASGMMMKYLAGSSGWPGLNSSSARLDRNQLSPVPVLPCSSSTPLTISPFALRCGVPIMR